MRGYLLIYLLLTATLGLAGPADTIDTPTYYESALGGTVRFFYDDRYYLTDKRCPFKSIERVGKFDFRQQQFAGEFVDFDNQGRAILRGRYADGKKAGQFTAYHANGQLKWEVTFVDDVPRGIWAYYYPDGKPLLEVAFGADGATIRNFWDARGRHRVVDGNGRYEFEVEADGYNEYGYVRYNRRGKVVDGRPEGNWIVEYVFEDGEKTGAGHEYYKRGRFIRGYEAYTDEAFADAPRYRLLPLDVFDRAPLMISKSCTIDEYSGFSFFLAERLDAWFKNDLQGLVEPQPIEFRILVDENGEPRHIEARRTFTDKRAASGLLAALHTVDFWFPSFAGGQYVEDTLTLTADVALDTADQSVHFVNIRIARENGN